MDELEKYDKKVYVLLNPSIAENFKKNIFNIEKVKTNMINSQCTRDKYIKLIGSYSDLDNLRKIEPKINKDVYDILLPEKSISNKNSYGGTSLKQVSMAIKRAKKRI